ncbi:hypothetical protein M422DRAFT_254306 [Sphaerobolus stellatus SS14]|uniref:Uncharacterized protein n=1 Tax=Sphaerobolus stellatus (strain SS14) TaxID=990650 RepID=A0A0C9VVA7_SPHS4|nr:hypothetical protein M422DRAFT_254306 [Sphaerobolus stellatus SS14]
MAVAVVDLEEEVAADIVDGKNLVDKRHNTVGEDESPQGLTVGVPTDPHQLSVDPQQTTEVFAPEHQGDQNVRAHGPQTVPEWVQSPIGTAGTASTSMPNLCPLRVARASGTATPGQDSPQGIISGSESGHSLSGAPDKSDHVSPDEEATENEDSSFTIRASEVGRLCEEYADLINLKENAEIVLVEAMEATETSMNRMSPMMKKLLIVSKPKSSGKTIEPGNNQACDKAAVKAATK